MDDRDVATVMETIDDLVIVALADFAQAILDIGFQFVRRAYSLRPIFQYRTQRRSRLGQFVGQFVQLGILPVADDQPLLFVEHAKALRHIRNGRVEMHLLIFNDPLGGDLRGYVFVGGNPAAGRHRSDDNVARTTVGPVEGDAFGLTSADIGEKVAAIGVDIELKCVDALARPQDFTERPAWLHEIGAQPRQFEIALVPDHGPLGRVEHDDTLRHAVERDGA